MIYDEEDILNQLDDLLKGIRKAEQTLFKEMIDSLDKLVSKNVLTGAKTTRYDVANLIKSDLANKGVLVNSSLNRKIDQQVSNIINKIATAERNRYLSAGMRPPDNTVWASSLSNQITRRLSVVFDGAKNSQLQNLGDAYIKNIDDYKKGLIGRKKFMANVAQDASVNSYRVRVTQKNGTLNYSVDAVMMRLARTEINQETLGRTFNNIAQAGINLVEVSAHEGARPEHAEWQGQVYWLHTPVKGYESFAVCGYGEVDGLGGVNCRHRFAPFFEGVNDEPQFIEKDPALYEKTQELRALERKALKAEHEYKLQKAGGAVDKRVEERYKLTREEAKSYAKSNNLNSRL